MRPSFFQRYRFSFFIVGVLVCLVAIFQGSQLVGGYFLSTHLNTPTPGANVSLSTTPALILTQGSTSSAKRHHFEAGITFPQWRQDAYGQSDTSWQQGIRDIRTQTRADWIEMIILFFQDSLTSTQVTVQPTT